MLAPTGGVDAARRFYTELVGLEEIDRPDMLGGVGAWFRGGSQELHVTEHDGFVPAKKAHPGFELEPDEFDALTARLEAAGAEVRWDERLQDRRRFYSYDPAGNRLEFLTRR